MLDPVLMARNSYTDNCSKSADTSCSLSLSLSQGSKYELCLPAKANPFLSS
jgi:hypothetical protein